MIRKVRSEATGKIDSLGLAWGWRGRVTGAPGVGSEAVTQDQVTGRLAINRLVEHLEISFTMKGVVGRSHFTRR